MKLLLDGQQRVTTLYGAIRRQPPKFFEGDPKSFTGLRFNIETEVFEFYQPIKMKDDILWIDVSEYMNDGNGLGSLYGRLRKHPELEPRMDLFVNRLNKLSGIKDIELHVEEVTGKEKTLEVVVDIFNRLNSGGTKLSKGDLALAKICAGWPDARDAMKQSLNSWSESGYDFKLDWLLRSINTILTGESKFVFLHDRSAPEIQLALKSAKSHIDTALNMISGRLGLDHDRVLFGRFGIPVMVRYIAKKKDGWTSRERDKLLFWFAQAGMWGRYSASVETRIDQDLDALEGAGGGLDALVEQLRKTRGGLRVKPNNFEDWSTGSRFYPVLYMLTRMGEARDWGTGLPLKAGLLGNLNRLELHHIFPKSKLYESEYSRPEVNALANFCFQTKGTNLNISNKLPEDYFPLIEKTHPGALASQWIPDDQDLWRIENYREFLSARRELLADEANRHFEELLHGESGLMEESSIAAIAPTSALKSRISSDSEELEIEQLNQWVAKRGLVPGQVAFGFTDPMSGSQSAVFDLAWENGLQEGLTEPVAVLFNEPMEVLTVASAAGFRCFTSPSEFKRYVESSILGSATA